MKLIAVLKINVTRILKEHLYQGKSGKYLDLAVLELDEADQYGNTLSVTQSLSKEARERGEKGPFIGNGKFIESKKKTMPPQKTKPTVSNPEPEPDEEDVPF